MFSNTLMNNFLTSMSNKNATTLPKKKASKSQKISTNYSNKFLKQSTAACSFLSLETLPEITDSNFPQELEARLSDSQIQHNAYETQRNSKLRQGNSKVERLSSTFSSLSQSSDDKESELIGMLTKQLYLATNQIQKMQTIFLKMEEKLKSKEQEIGTLKRKNKEFNSRHRLQESKHKRELQERRKQITKSENLDKKCRTLEARIFEMEKFLEDYGLVWIGGLGNSSLSDLFTKDYIESCFPQVIANIEELNIAAGKDEVQVQHSQDGAGASFKVPKCMILKFFKNGLIVEGGRLRPYSDPLTKCFIRDILDGYFPSEFQNNYPSGVPLKVEDHRKEIFVVDGTDFPGYGYRLGKLTSSQNNSTTRTSKSANSWPGSAHQSPVNTNRERSVQSTRHDLSNKSSRSRNKVDSLTMFDLNNLRLQISASHNHNCSDTHLQSHMNAELALSARKPKVREVTTKSTDCYFTLKQNSPTRFEKVEDVAKNDQNGKNNNAQSSSKLSSLSNCKFRSRSASLSEKRRRTEKSPNIGSKCFFIPQNTASRLQNTAGGSKICTPRASKSATGNIGKELPFLLQINEPSYNKKELRLKVRSLNGGKVYLVHISADETVARLYQILNKFVIKDGSTSKKYHIVTNGYESKRLVHLHSTLTEYGITRDSVLHLVNG